MIRLCPDCGNDFSQRHVLAERCLPCAQKSRPRRGVVRPNVNGRSKDPLYVSAQNAAGRLLNREIAAGRMPKAKGLVCADCGLMAQVYDHRDYAKPLEVQPVCRSCNMIRGHAVAS